MNCRRPLTWLLVVVLFSFAGAAIGGLLDRLFWYISYDYIYRPRQFLNVATKVAFFVGTFSAATATVGSPAPAKPRKLIAAWFWMLVSVLLIGLLCGCIGGGLSKWLTADAANGSLAPRTRLWFCEGIRVGVLIATIAATCAWNFVVFRCRFHERFPFINRLPKPLN